MAGKLVWDGKGANTARHSATCRNMPQEVVFDDGSAIYGFPSKAIPVVPRRDMVPAPWGGFISRDLLQEVMQLPFAYGLTDDPHSRSLNAVEEPNG